MTLRSLFALAVLSALSALCLAIATAATDPSLLQDPDATAEAIGAEEERNELLDEIRADRESASYIRKLLGDDDDDEDEDEEEAEAKRKADRDTPEEKLCKAAWRGDTALVRRLVEKDRVDIEARAHEDGKATPLFYAAWKGHTDTVKYLLEEGADYHSRDAKNMSPLHMARRVRLCSAEDFSRLGHPAFTAMAWIFILAYCFAIP